MSAPMRQACITSRKTSNCHKSACDDRTRRTEPTKGSAASNDAQAGAVMIVRRCRERSYNDSNVEVARIRSPMYVTLNTAMRFAASSPLEHARCRAGACKTL